MNLLFHTFIVHFLLEQVTTVETVEGGIHGEELWGVEGQADGGDCQQSGGDTRELKDRITELERQVESYKKALEESIQEPEANKLMELVEQVSAERDGLVTKCNELVEKLNVDKQSTEGMQSTVEDLRTRLKEAEQNYKESDKELTAKSQTELDMLAQINDLQDELTKALEAVKAADELKERLQEDLETSEETLKDLEREKGVIQKQLNESFLQIVALKVLALKVMLHETIRNDDFYRNTALQHCCHIVWNGYNIVPTLLRCVATTTATTAKTSLKGAPSTSVHCGRAFHRNHLLYYEITNVLIVFENRIQGNRRL